VSSLRPTSRQCTAISWHVLYLSGIIYRRAETWSLVMEQTGVAMTARSSSSAVRGSHGGDLCMAVQCGRTRMGMEPL